MVTHDVGLKEFADRVIWMSDGKIKHVEHISPATKQSRLQKLNEETDKIMKGEKQAYVNFQHTFIRKPTDYSTHPDHDPSESKCCRFQFTEEYMGFHLKEEGSGTVISDGESANNDVVDSTDSIRLRLIDEDERNYSSEE
eukprot:TRINITY_DN4165_c0_g1_i4.p2 TRINITY_DN4165_c0_g1~~TRINITY_DN4165_c0_g1_i4.p2  ORF type:complete len:140 (+),score=30.69 TRINITY_DN4165_c0_g1_i4:797-1216(+)